MRALFRSGITVLTVVAAALLGGADGATASPQEQEFVYHGASYGYAGATFDWTGPGSVANIDLIVSDWACDNHPVYAYFEFWDGALRPDRIPGSYYDYSGCDTGDYSPYPDLSYHDSRNITYMTVVICGLGPNSGCEAGFLSGRNPHAP